VRLEREQELRSILAPTLRGRPRRLRKRRRRQAVHLAGVVGCEIKVGEDRISAYANSYLLDPDVRARHAERIRQLPIELRSSEEADQSLEPAFFETEADDQSVGEDFCESVALFLADHAHGRLPLEWAQQSEGGVRLAAPSEPVCFAAAFPHRAQALEALFFEADGSTKHDLNGPRHAVADS
jgi:hypothetical protein